MRLTKSEQNIVEDLLLDFACDFADNIDVERAYDPVIGLEHPTLQGYVRAMLEPVTVAAMLADLARMAGVKAPDMALCALGER